jgi:acyl-CoA thioester hydrolase
VIAPDGSADAPDVYVRDRVWWSDVDQMGVMYFARYVRFAEMAETEFFRAVGYSFDDIRALFGLWLGRVRLAIDFLSPAKLDDELICRVELVKLGAASLHFRFPVERASDGRRVAEIRLVVACLDAATLKTTRIPLELRTKLRARVV